MIDTHCHLYEESFLPSLDEVLHRAKEAGVTQILLPNIDVDSWDPLLKVLNNPIIPCSPMLGLHPCYVKEDVNDQLNALGELLKTHHEQLVAIGEIGCASFHHVAAGQKFQRDRVWCLFGLNEHSEPRLSFDA